MKKVAIILALTLLGFSCDKTTTPPDLNEGETITTVRLNFTEVGNPGNTFTAEWSDPDGAGGNPATIDTINLVNGTNYTVTVEFWNESVTPAEDMTAEIVAESDEHIVCFDALNGFDATISITDQDANSLPIGLASDWTVNAMVNGDLMISLKHQPGTKDGTCGPGDTDVEVTFPVVVN